MRKVVSGLFISLDGVVEAPNEWQFDNFDEDMATLMAAFLETEDTVLLGRVTYQDWAPYWPTSTDEPYASHINTTPKYIASTTLTKVDWQNSTLIKGSVADEVARLNSSRARTSGPAAQPWSWLLRNDLLDELTHGQLRVAGRETPSSRTGRLKECGFDSKTTHRCCVLTPAPNSNNQRTISRSEGIPVKIHLVDGTYELFRSFYGAPPKKAPDGREVGAALGLVRSLMLLLADPGVTHVACAFDHVIESFRNDLFAGYKTGEGVDPALLAQFPLAEGVSALGVVWPMVEFKADDALGPLRCFQNDAEIEKDRAVLP
jgi:dihydrofolate reductase